MSDLDLLERQIDHPQMPVQLGAKLHSVIQRLREAEARTSLGDEQIIDEQDAAIKRLTARIDRLERVREKAAGVQLTAHRDPAVLYSAVVQQWWLALGDALAELDAPG